MVSRRRHCHELSAPRRNQGFGSSDLAFWVQEISTQRPFEDLKVQGVVIKGLTDPGADVSCIAEDHITHVDTRQLIRHVTFTTNKNEMLS